MASVCFAAMKKTALQIVSLSAALLGSAHAITLQTVTIGDPGNPNDPATGGLYGAVAATYAIGKYEVTLTEYTAFLSAVAVTDTYALYNTTMGTNLNIAGISRTGSSGSYSYAVSGDGARPVTYVSWFDAARFSNWLHNGQPTGLQVAGTTEQGAYTLNGATSGIVLKNAGAQDWLPSESEWYKAAYYQPAAAGGDADGYWLYPTKSNSVPGNTIGGAANQGNFHDGADFSVTQSGSYSSTQNYLTAGGAYSNSASYYGTFDQGGNVIEWNDAVITSSRGLRGGS